MTGLVVLAAAVLASVVVALVIRARNGRFAEPVDDGDSADVLTAAMIGAPLGRDVTLVQFSSAFCAPCRATRTLLTDVAAHDEGVETVEIDAESHLDLVRRLHVLRTPTVLVLDADGAVRTRASGLPNRSQVLATIAAARSATM